MENPVFLKTSEEKLNWLASREPNPTRNQIREYIPDFIDDDCITEALYWEKGMLKWYDNVAKDIIHTLNEPEQTFNHFRKKYISLNNPKLIDMIDGMYHDVINNDKWGFIFDW